MNVVNNLGCKRRRVGGTGAFLILLTPSRSSNSTHQWRTALLALPR